MTRFSKIVVRGGLVLALAASVAACGTSTKAPDSPVILSAPARQEDQFGTAFGTAFRADSNSAPYSPADGDIVAVSLSTEPVPIK